MAWRRRLQICLVPGKQWALEIRRRSYSLFSRQPCFHPTWFVQPTTMAAFGLCNVRTDKLVSIRKVFFKILSFRSVSSFSCSHIKTFVKNQLYSLHQACNTQLSFEKLSHSISLISEPASSFSKLQTPMMSPLKLQQPWRGDMTLGNATSPGPVPTRPFSSSHSQARPPLRAQYSRFQLLTPETATYGLFAVLKRHNLASNSILHRQAHINDTAFGHPVCIVGLKDNGRVSVCLQVTSFSGKTIEKCTYNFFFNRPRCFFSPP